MTRRRYRDQATLLLKARDWMQQLDVKVSPTRIGKYVKMLNLLADHHEQGKIDDLQPPRFCQRGLRDGLTWIIRTLIF